MLLTLGASAPAASAASRGGDDPYVLTACIQFLGPDHEDMQAVVRRTAGLLLAAARISVRWVACAAADALAERPSAIVLLSLRDVAPPHCGNATSNLATAGGVAVVSIPCVRAVLHDLGRSPVGRGHPQLRALSAGALASLVAAHEIGHLLGLGHSRSGVMSARIETGELAAFARGELRFRSGEIGRMRASLSAWTALARRRLR